MAIFGLGISRQSMRLRCEAVHVAKYRLLLGTRQMATRTFDVSCRTGASFVSQIYNGPRRQSTSSTAYSPTLLL